MTTFSESSEFAGSAGSTQWWQAPDEADGDWLAWANRLPFCHDLGLRCLQMDEYVAVFTMAQSALTPNPDGSVNGGLLAAAADQVMGALTRRGIGPSRLPATASLHVQYHAPATAPLTLRVGRLGGGHRMRFLEVVIEDRDGNRCATAQATMVARSADRRR